MSAFFATLLTVLSIFLILLILVQRGRGGGLTGALGGMGGSSAFGAKAGDVFTRITIVTATIWIGVCVAAAYWSNPSHHSDRLGGSSTPPASSAPAGDKKPVDSTGTTGSGAAETPKSGESGSTSAPATETAKPAETPAEAPANEGKK
jgi:preprotein translocase subunit SecG